MGDFNIDFGSPKSSRFLDTISACGFHTGISQPTRVTSKSSSLIDNILTNVNTIDAVVVDSSGILLTDM
ncbi:hypothetical protein HOLleu_44421 [Holothuria leucospilota]|uniref:Uncharacterized protein n=1 Tax=Holothuria leucospilota TaxID=206669 RepID=A0A9Q1B8P2_HOLLE|nr:hypothetical protein HOLleu_44421 [Holothuria leucospilota]